MAVDRDESSLPEVSRLQAFLDSRNMIRDPVNVLARYSSNIGETFVYYFGGLKKVVVTRDPIVLRHVLKDNYTNYHKSKIQMKHMGQFLGPGLLTSHGEYWLKQRQLIQKGFRRDKLTSLAAGMHAGLAEGLERFDDKIRGGPIDLCPQVRALTFRMITRSLLSAGLDDEETDLIDRAITELQDFAVRQMIYPYLAPWFSLSGELRRHHDLRRRGEDILLERVRRRRREGHAKDDILQVLLDAQYDHGRGGMTDEQILNECLQLLIAAHETSSTALCWAMYLLCRHPEFLKRAAGEFEDVLGDAPVSYADVPALEFNRAVLDEALRLYPPVWLVDRVALADDRAGAVDIPKGTTVIAFIYGAHHAPEIWSEAGRFDPGRFSEGSGSADLSYVYLPFGAGPRGCIGGNYAQLQMLLILGELVRHYEFSLVESDEVDTRSRIILRPKGGIPVNVSKKTR